MDREFLCRFTIGLLADLNWLEFDRERIGSGTWGSFLMRSSCSVLCCEDWFGDKEELTGTVLGIWWWGEAGPSMLGLLGWGTGLKVDRIGGLSVRRLGLTAGRFESS